MVNETRVNLLHLLEDIRDSYALPIEEVIVTELVANALDSGASSVNFFIDPPNLTLRCVDSGCGMMRKELREYHNIAATTKIRGKGIGFAGVGAKLSLLVANRVMTETRGKHGSRGATEWHLASPLRAPWRYLTFSGTLEVPRGTSITIFLREPASLLLNKTFVVNTLKKHFLPLFHQKLFQTVFRLIYKKGISFCVNHEKIQVSESFAKEELPFQVFLGKSSRRPVGAGFLWRLDSAEENSSTASGLAVSTYGKIIKRGWEWLGIIPKSHQKIGGIVEIPGLAELLTTNKTDFLNDAASLRKYYRYRKAIQESILSVLKPLGEIHETASSEFSQRIKPLQREIEETLSNLVPRFPELGAVIGVRHRNILGKAAALKKEDYLTGVAASGEKDGNSAKSVSDVSASEAGEKISSVVSSQDESGKDKVRSKSPGLKIVFEELGDGSPSATLGRMIEDTIHINSCHPAWLKAKVKGLEEYHVLLSVAWVLSGFLEENRSPHEFVSEFLSHWGKQERGAQRLFKV